MTIEPDSKDWTWVITSACIECGFDPGTASRGTLPARMLAAAQAVRAELDGEDVRVRPDESTWSKLEYAAHVRDVARIMRGRLALMIERDDPEFENWDQDATAEADAYNEQEPARVASEIDVAAVSLADAFTGLDDPTWERVGRRSNGSVFTVYTLGVYALHDLEHHVWDVTGSQRQPAFA